MTDAQCVAIIAAFIYHSRYNEMNDRGFDLSVTREEALGQARDFVMLAKFVEMVYKGRAEA